MEVYLNLFLITLIVVNLIDISGIVQSIENGLAIWLNVKKVSLPMVGCSYCMNHHLSVIYLLFFGGLSLKTYLFILIMSSLTEVFKWLIFNVRDIIQYIVDKLLKIIK